MLLSLVSGDLGLSGVSLSKAGSSVQIMDSQREVTETQAPTNK